MTAFQSIAELSASRLLNSVGEGLLIALVTWVLLGVVGRRNSGTRFAVWFTALIAITALPLLRLGTRTGTAITRPEFAIASSWAVYIFAAWTLIAAVALMRIALGLWRVRKLRRSCVPIKDVPSGSFVPVVVIKSVFTAEDTREHKGPTTEGTEQQRGFQLQAVLGRRIRVCVSDQVRVPTAIGFFNPMVVIPAWTLTELPPEELNSVILHEVAHLRRWDDWSNLAQKIIRALFFFHPAVWWIDNRLALEREMACDDLVLAETENPRRYAECLVSLAEKNFLRRGLAMAQAAVGHIRHISRRVARILEHRQDRTKPVSTLWKAATALPLVVVSAAGAIAVANTLPLVGFQGAVRPATSVASAALPAAPAVATAVPLESKRTSVAAMTPVKTVARNTVTTKISDRSSYKVIPARARNSRPHRPAVLQANARQPRNQPASFVVVETRYYSGSQGAIWSVTVWHVQSGGPEHQQVVLGIIPQII